MNIAWARMPERRALARALLRDEVARSCDVNRNQVSLAVMCAVCGSDSHGRLHVLPIRDAATPYVSLSRADGVSIVAVTHSGPVGVDVECVDALSFAGFDAVALHPDEQAGTIEDRATTWVRKESLLKATGHGLSVDPRRIRLGEPGEPPHLVEWVGDNPPQNAVWMDDIDVGPDHRACISVLSATRPLLSVREVAREDFPREAKRGTDRRDHDRCVPERSR